MLENTNAEIRHIYEQWHACVVRHDLDGLMALYDEEAVLETPLILAVLKDKDHGILEGKAAITFFFGRFAKRWKWSWPLVSNRHLLFQWPATYLGIPARHAARGSG